MKYKILALTFIAVLMLAGCGSPGGNTAPVADDSSATEEGVKSVISANNQFAFDFYSEIKKSEDGNIFFSPWSLSTALAMTYEGARGRTAEEMQAVFHFPEDSAVRRPSFAKLYNEVNKKDKEYKLSTANALWAQKDYRFLPEYLGMVEKYYGGKTTNLDFVGQTEQSRQTINKWVEEQTGNNIKDLIPPGVLTDMTRLVLTNAIYFKGTWLKEFDKKSTKEEDFRIGPANTVRIQMMGLTGNEANFNYAETGDMQAVELPYDGKELSMLILLPKKDSIGAAEDAISLEKLSELRSMLREQRVDVYLPRFKFETKYFLKENLKSMGMPLAFSDDADLSGMDGTQMLKIAQVIHQAFVEVNEEGTEAAAATAVIVVFKSAMPAMPTIFRADHPFMFIIQERETGNILFMGRVVDPRG